MLYLEWVTSDNNFPNELQILREISKIPQGPP